MVPQLGRICKGAQDSFWTCKPSGISQDQTPTPSHGQQYQTLRIPSVIHTLASRVGWGEQALCFQFYDGLPERLKDWLAMLGKPDLLHNLVLVTQWYNNLYWERQEEGKLAHQWHNKPMMNANLWGPNTSNPRS